MKNLLVNFSRKSALKKKMIHNSVAFLKNELKFQVRGLIINFVNKEEIININKKYLGHNYSTDIITFDYSETNTGLDSEIFISLDDAAKNAGIYGSIFEQEIVRLVTHGILHLTGYNDISEKERKVMKLAEDNLVLKQKEIWSNDI